ncbi:hypothetical protein CAEBREN_09249 [Caenorhabditis brenneri]|uniref:Uncharacterized protein n=1 Tax=Caenorhabditis brenneri TaxID=135651 RepID=G0NNU4_CAEBE|nr:hypothetical protein CAEBREN_09249 [Caenorhabditis brenneri]
MYIATSLLICFHLFLSSLYWPPASINQLLPIVIYSIWLFGNEKWKQSHHILALYDEDKILSFYAFCCLFGIIFCGYYFGILMQQVHKTLGDDDAMIFKGVICQNLFFNVITGVASYEFIYIWRGEFELLENAGKVDCDGYTQFTTNDLEGVGHKDPLDVIE